MSERTDEPARSDTDAHAPPAGLHRHEHEHAGERHRHVHHHDPAGRAALHEHGHGTGFERLTYLVSPVHESDPRAKIVAALVLILAIVLSPPLRLVEFVLFATLLVTVALIARLPILTVLARAALVLPVAATIALFAPLARSGGSLSAGGIAGAYGDGGWIAAWAIVSKAWLSTLVVVILAATTPVARLIRGLEALRVPDVFITMLSFLSRYAGVLHAQIRSVATAVSARAPGLPRLRRWSVYGNLAGNLLIRSYDRGERIHAAMLSRGFTGRLPTAEVLHFRASDALMVATACMAAAAVVLY